MANIPNMRANGVQAIEAGCECGRLSRLCFEPGAKWRRDPARRGVLSERSVQILRAPPVADEGAAASLELHLKRD
jgi:hypothetical protein